MITAQDLYNASDGGLDIILMCVTDPQKVRDAILGNKKFALRNERTPSSSARQYGGIWKVTDFGDTGHAESPIDLYMRVNNIRSFGEAVILLAQHFGVTDELSPSLNKPHIEKKPAASDQQEGQKYFEMNEQFTEKELRILGVNVRQQTVDALHWHSVKWICDIKNREATYKYANENYPIFMRECLVEKGTDGEPDKVFFKIYEPLNPQKQWRFQYTPKGAKPRQYINGFAELRDAYEKANAEDEQAFFADPANEGRPFKKKKLECAVICSGERDALCVRALGYHPLWFNSETYKVTEDEHWSIMQMVETLYNIPDIDSTGIVKGTELALRFRDLHTVWLPDWLSTYKDNRGKPRKDFRDWTDIKPLKQDFKDLLQLAKPAKFWTSTWNEKRNKLNFEIDSDCLRYFLRLQGFYTIHDDTVTTPHYIHVHDNIVRNVTQKDIAGFLINWAEEECLSRDIRNLILNSPRIATGAIANLKEIELDFTKCTAHSQLFFFQNATFEVKGDTIDVYSGRTSSLTHYVWEENVLKHNVRLLDEPFRIHAKENADGTKSYTIDILDTSSHFFGFLINSSRVYWRKELEEAWDDPHGEEARKYRETHRFCINSELLSQEEVEEQMLNLVNKIFGIGYWMHRYKSASRAWALFAMDNKISEDGECNGRSGKSFYFKALSFFGKMVKLSGRNPKLMDNPHVFDQVTKYTDYILVDDCDRYLHTGLFYDIITSDMTVNPKNNQSYTLPFETSPKLAFTTNYVPSNFDPSTDARLLYLAFSDYYHQKTEDNDYLETRSIRDDFGRDLFANDYSEKEWEADCNFIMRCTQFYLSVVGDGKKIQPRMDNIVRRKLMSDMVMGFAEWADAYFSPISGHLNKMVVKDEAMRDFISSYNVKGLSPHRFSKSLKAYALLHSRTLELNPLHLCNNGDRIIRKDQDGQAKAMIYLRTKDANDTEQTEFIPDEEPF